MKVLSLSVLLPAGQSGPSSLYTLSSLAQEGFSGPCWAGTMLVFVVLRYGLSTYLRLALNSYGPLALALLVLGFWVWATTPDLLWLMDTPLQSTRLWATRRKFCHVVSFVLLSHTRGLVSRSSSRDIAILTDPATRYLMMDFKAG